MLSLAATAHAVVIASEDFDGGAVNLTSSSVPALDGGAGDWFGVGSRNAWPQGFPSPGMPFGLADDTVFGVSNGGAPFASDAEGVFGQNSDFDNDFFGISDSDEFLAAQTASWTFDISGGSNLVIRIDMGGVSDAASGGYSLSTNVVFTASIDGGGSQVVFDLDAVDNTFGYLTRPMDDGDPSGGGRLLVVSGDNAVSKLLAENGSTAGDTFLNKTPASGPGAGRMDTFLTTLNGSGSQLVLTLVCDVPFEALAFDNIVIEGDAATPAEKSSWGRLKSLYRQSRRTSTGLARFGRPARQRVRRPFLSSVGRRPPPHPDGRRVRTPRAIRRADATDSGALAGRRANPYDAGALTRQPRARLPWHS
jgi:hypothetical protein